MRFTKESPSPRYTELIELYRRLHALGEAKLGLSPEDTYPGISLLPHVETIKGLIAESRSNNVLDYGCGKAIAYALQSVDVPGLGQVGPLVDYWDVDFVSCYDPSYPLYSKRPSVAFDGVICTDVLEHCPEDDLEWIIDDLFGYARKFVFAVAACYPALAHLPNGENAHCTVRPPDWWEQRFTRAAQGSAKHWQLITQEITTDAIGRRTLVNNVFKGLG